MVTVEYVVAGPMMMVLGATQVWLKRAAARDQARRAADAATPPGSEAQSEQPVGAETARKPPLWDAWTGILGYVAIVFGLVVLILGLLGK
jgi:hypothetical protein